MGKTHDYIGDFPRSWSMGNRQKTNAGRAPKVGRIRWSTGAAPLPPIRETFSEDRQPREINPVHLTEIQRKNKAPLPPIRRDPSEQVRPSREDRRPAVSHIYQKLRPLIEELTGCVLGRTGNYPEANSRNTVQDGSMIAKAVDCNGGGEVQKPVRMITAERAVVLLRKIHEAFSRELDLQHSEYVSICQAIRKLHWSRPGLISMLMCSRNYSAESNEKTKLIPFRHRLISDRQNDSHPSAPHIRTVAADPHLSIQTHGHEGQAEESNFYRDQANRREIVKTHTATVPKRGQIKVTAMDYEMDNPEFYQTKQSEPSGGEKRHRKRASKIGKSYLINRPDIVDQIKIGDRLLYEENHLVPLTEDSDGLSACTVRDLTSLLKFTDQVAEKKQPLLSSVMFPQTTISPTVQQAMFASTTAPPYRTLGPTLPVHRQKRHGTRGLTQAFASELSSQRQISNAHIRIPPVTLPTHVIPSATPIVPRQTPVAPGQTPVVPRQTPGLLTQIPGVSKQTPATPDITTGPFSVTPTTYMYNPRAPPYTNPVSGPASVRILDSNQQRNLGTGHNNDTQVIPEEAVTEIKRQDTQDQAHSQGSRSMPKKCFLTPTAYSIEPIVLTRTAATHCPVGRDLQVPVWTRRR